MKRTVYAFGGKRLERLTSATDDEFDVVYQEEVIGDRPFQMVPIANYITMVLLTYAFLRRENPIVLADRFQLRRVGLLALCRLAGCPYLARTRGSMWGEFQDRNSSENGNGKAVQSFVETLSRNVVLRNADRILAVSFFNRMQIVYELPIGPKKIDVVHEPYDIRAYDRAPKEDVRDEHGIPDDHRVLLTVTGFKYRQKVRGIEYYFPAIHRVLQANPDWHYVVAGDGALRRQLETSILEQCDGDVAERVSFVGFYQPIVDLFADADVIVHTSFRDALPNAIIEAMAAGKPVIVNPEGGMQEALPGDYRSHQVVHDREEFLESAEQLIAEPELRQRIGRKNNERAEQVFYSEAVKDTFTSAIRNLASGNGSD